MLELHFEGWFQCRLARDPDPSDEKRGISGASFATVYEPDLDRIIRLNDPVASRDWFLPPDNQVPRVGVSVKAVYIRGQKNDNHPLLGARVDFLDKPVFQGLNGVLQSTGCEPIDPFHVRVSGNNIVLKKKDLWDPDRPGLTMYDLPLDSPLLSRRQPQGSEMRVLEVRSATGIFDADGYIRKRIQDLESAINERKEARTRADTGDRTTLDLQIAGLQQRLDALTIPPQLDLLFESQISMEAARALDARQSQPEILLSQLPEAGQLVTDFGGQDIRFSNQAVFVAEPDPATKGAGNGNVPPHGSVRWKIKDPMHWVNPSLSKQKPLFSGQLDSLLHLPAQFRIEKLLPRGSQYAIIAFEEVEPWQTKVFKILLSCQSIYQFDIRGPAEVEGDPGVPIATDLPWPVSFWMGAWDNDALSGYLKGYLQIPLTIAL
jgi:hypothetical protein